METILSFAIVTFMLRLYALKSMSSSGMHSVDTSYVPSSYTFVDVSFFWSAFIAAWSFSCAQLTSFLVDSADSNTSCASPRRIWSRYQLSCVYCAPSSDACDCTSFNRTALSSSPAILLLLSLLLLLSELLPPVFSPAVVFRASSNAAFTAPMSPFEL